MNRRTLVMIISVAILAVFAVAVFLYSQTTPPQPPQVAQAPAQMPPDAPNGGNLVRFHSPVFGPAQAPVTIVEFFDPSCEACRAFYPHVKKILVENPSDVRLVLRYVLFHQGSEEVTRMLEAARKQNLYRRYWRPCSPPSQAGTTTPRWQQPGSPPRAPAWMWRRPALTCTRPASTPYWRRICRTSRRWVSGAPRPSSSMAAR